MTTAENSGSLLLSDYFRVIARRRSVVLVGLVLGATLAWLFTVTQGQEYESTASILVKPVGISPENVSRPDQLVNLPTERQLIRSSSTVDLAREKMKTDTSVAELLSRLVITIPEGTQVLEVSFRASSPHEAQAGAQAFADAYLDRRGEQAQNDVRQRHLQITTEVEEVQELLLAANERFVDSEEGTLPRALAQSDIELLTSRLRDLQSERAEVDLLSIDPGDVIVAAPLPSRPASQPPWLITVVGLLAGGILALPLAFIRERLDDRVWDETDLEGFRIGPTLGIIPSRRRPTSFLGDGSASDEYRTLSHSLMSTLALAGARKVAVTSVDRDLNGDVTLGLATGTAALKYSVLMMGVDPPGDFDVRSQPTLEDVLTGEDAFGDAVQVVEELPALRLVVGNLPADVRAHWNTFSDLVEQLPSSTDFLMLNTPPVTASVDALQACALMDGVVLLVNRGKTTRSAVEKTADQIDAVGTKVLGVVLVR